MVTGERPSSASRARLASFTSGSTGVPKGVCVPHRAVNRLVVNSDYIQLGSEDVVAETTHGVDFAAIVVRGHVAGAQFHPERSGAVGARFLRNFLAWEPS